MLAYLFLIFAIAVRFMPHPWSFTPLAAALLFFGAYRRRSEFWIAVALVAASDVALNAFVYHSPMGADQYVTFIWYFGACLLGSFLSEDQRPLRLAGASLSASVTFFLASNLAVWAVWQMYPKTFAGLVQCYVAGIPFFRNSVAGDLFFTSVFFGIGALSYGLSQSSLQKQTINA